MNTDFTEPEINGKYIESKKTRNTPNSKDDDETSIRELVVTYNIPHKIANKLIGKTEKETAENIRKFKIKKGLPVENNKDT